MSCPIDAKPIEMFHVPSLSFPRISGITSKLALEWPHLLSNAAYLTAADSVVAFASYHASRS